MICQLQIVDIALYYENKLWLIFPFKSLSGLWKIFGEQELDCHVLCGIVASWLVWKQGHKNVKDRHIIQSVHVYIGIWYFMRFYCRILNLLVEYEIVRYVILVDFFGFAVFKLLIYFTEFYLLQLPTFLSRIIILI